MKDKQVPKEIYVLQVFDENRGIYVNAYTRTHNDGFYMDEDSAKRAMRNFLGNDQRCRIIQVPVIKSEITNYIPDDVLSRKYHRYYRSEVNYIKKFSPDFENSLYKVRFIKLTDVKSDKNKPYYTVLTHLIKESEDLHINYGMIVQLKQVSGLLADKVYFVPLAQSAISDLEYYKIDSFWRNNNHPGDFDLWNIHEQYKKQNVELARKFMELETKLAYSIDFSENHPAIEVDDKFLTDNQSGFIKEGDLK